VSEGSCDDCGRPLRVTGADACRREHPTAELFGFDVECKNNTIARLRAQLAAAEKLSVAERELVDANIAHERATSHATSSRLERAITTLLSVRAKEAT
jgi:hypothetical protein